VMIATDMGSRGAPFLFLLLSTVMVRPPICGQQPGGAQAASSNSQQLEVTLVVVVALYGDCRGQ